MVAPKDEYKENVNIFHKVDYSALSMLKFSIFPHAYIMYARVRIHEFTKFNRSLLITAYCFSCFTYSIFAIFGQLPTISAKFESFEPL